MTPRQRLAALSGVWRTARVIRHAGGGTARFAGLSTWARDGDGLRCVEAGRLTQGGAGFEARRETLWRATDAGLEVRFADGRPFHVIEGPRAQHDCPPDTYLLDYDWTGWPRWSLRWRVTGPRKDYRALTRYRPA